MFWILNSHQAVATRSCALTWAPWCKLPYAVPEFYYSSLIPLLLFSSVPPFFPGHPCFSCVNYFSKQFSASPVALWCDANWTISAEIILWLLSWLWVISLLFFGPFTDFYHFVLCFIIKHPFLFNLRSVDHVVFYEAWWMWRLPKLVGIWERGTDLIMQWRHKRGRWGPGRIILKVLYGEVLHRSPNTYSLLYTISAKKAPLLYTFHRQTGIPFT